MNFKFDIYHVIARISDKTGAQEYLAIDSHSGGYPYWINSLNSAEKYQYPPSVKDEIPTHKIEKDWTHYLLQLSTAVLGRWSLIDAEEAQKQAEIEKLEAEAADIARKIEQLKGK